MAGFLVRDWAQSYRKRNPTWIKVRVDLLDSIDWRTMPLEAKGLLVDVWLLAARMTEMGELPPANEIAYFLNQPHDVVEQCIRELARLGFLIPQEQWEPGWPKQAVPTPAAPPAFKKEWEQAWLDFKRAYPDRSGAARWPESEQAYYDALKTGVDPDAVLAGAQAYAQWCSKRGVAGTERVMQAKTFLEQRAWQDNWHPPTDGAGANRSMKLDDGRTIIL